MFYIMNIREEIKVLIVREGTSMRRIVNSNLSNGYDIPNESTLSYEFKNNRVRFSTVQDILEILGYELVIKKKQK